MLSPSAEKTKRQVKDLFRKSGFYAILQERHLSFERCAIRYVDSIVPFPVEGAGLGQAAAEREPLQNPGSKLERACELGISLKEEVRLDKVGKNGVAARQWDAIP